jgi:hypothetical protein
MGPNGSPLLFGHFLYCLCHNVSIAHNFFSNILAVLKRSPTSIKCWLKVCSTGWCQQVQPTLVSCMNNVINVYMCVSCLICLYCTYSLICSNMCACGQPKTQAKAICPSARIRAAKQNSICGNDSEGVCKQQTSRGSDKDQSMGTGWTSSHQHQPHVNSSSMTIFDNAVCRKKNHKNLAI